MNTNTLFSRREPTQEQIVFVLSLDRKEMKERILIGEEMNIRYRLSVTPSSPVLLDITRPLGTILLNFEENGFYHWAASGFKPLYDALHSNRWAQPKLEQSASSFLKKQFKSGDPVRMYTSFRIWNDYLLARLPRERDAASETFYYQFSRLTDAFYDETLPERKHYSPASSTLSPLVPSANRKDSRLELWYPDYSRPFECVSAHDSFHPLITYYFHRLNEWGFCFKTCKVCGQTFLAKNHRYDLCSEICRKKQALQNKRAFDLRAKDNLYDHQYKNESQNWRNHINRAKTNPEFTPEQIAHMEEVFASFRKEALAKKKLVKQKKLSPKEFSDWLYAQSATIVQLSK